MRQSKLTFWTSRKHSMFSSLASSLWSRESFSTPTPSLFSNLLSPRFERSKTCGSSEIGNRVMLQESATRSHVTFFFSVDESAGSSCFKRNMGLGRGKRLKSRQSSGYVAWRASGRHQRMQSEKRAKECVSEDFSRTRQNKSALSEGRTKRRVWADLQVQRTHRRVCVVTEI